MFTLNSSLKRVLLALTVVVGMSIPGAIAWAQDQVCYFHIDGILWVVDCETGLPLYPMGGEAPEQPLVPTPPQRNNNPQPQPTAKPADNTVRCAELAQKAAYHDGEAARLNADAAKDDADAARWEVERQTEVTLATSANLEAIARRADEREARQMGETALAEAYAAAAAAAEMRRETHRANARTLFARIEAAKAAAQWKRGMAAEQTAAANAARDEARMLGCSQNSSVA